MLPGTEYRALCSVFGLEIHQFYGLACINF